MGVLNATLSAESATMIININRLWRTNSITAPSKAIMIIKGVKLKIDWVIIPPTIERSMMMPNFLMFSPEIVIDIYYKFLAEIIFFNSLSF